MTVTSKHLHYANYCSNPLITCRHAEEAFIREIASTPLLRTQQSYLILVLSTPIISHNAEC